MTRNVQKVVCCLAAGLVGVLFAIGKPAPFLLKDLILVVLLLIVIQLAPGREENF